MKEDNSDGDIWVVLKKRKKMDKKMMKFGMYNRRERRTKGFWMMVMVGDDDRLC
jgi:hypothetical protein